MSCVRGEWMARLFVIGGWWVAGVVAGVDGMGMGAGDTMGRRENKRGWPEVVL